MATIIDIVRVVERQKAIQESVMKCARAIEQIEKNERAIRQMVKSAQYRSPLDAVLQSFAYQNRELPKASIRLAKRGWLIAPAEFLASDLNLLEKISKQSDDAIDHQMILYARKRADQIIKRVKKDFPMRSCVIDVAYTAHRRGEYILSIPVFLAQADGICQEKFSVSLYSKKSSAKKSKIKEPKVKDKLQRLTPKGLVDRITLEPYYEVLPFQENSEKGGPLNRHGILHGILLDYGTEANSLRSIMLLESFRWIRQIESKGKKL